MRLRLLALTAVVALGCAPSMFGAITQELTLSDGLGDSFTIDQDGNIVSTSGTVTIAATNISVTGFGGIEVTSKALHPVMLGTNITVKSAEGLGWGDVGPLELQNEVSTDVDATSSGTLTVTYVDTSYSDISPLINLSSSESTASTPGSDSTMSEYGSIGVNLTPSTLIGTLKTLTGPSDNDTRNLANIFSGASVSLLAQTVLVFGGAGTINTTYDVAQVIVPEPASIVFMGTTLLGLSALMRRKLGKRA
jgi:hypothetical protein